MNAQTQLNNESGFSLVELMVVVAIIGILASMSTGQVQKQIAKARQAEAKTNLATIYTAEKSFQAEWAAFTTDIGSAGVGYDGNMRYIVGFIADGSPATAANIPGYTGTASGVFQTGTTVGACPAALGTCNIIATNGNNPVAPTGAAVGSPTAFLAEANSPILSATSDQWTMSQNKILSQTQNGI